MSGAFIAIPQAREGFITRIREGGTEDDKAVLERWLSLEDEATNTLIPPILLLRLSSPWGESTARLP
jgi:hypothetical protein